MNKDDDFGEMYQGNDEELIEKKSTEKEELKDILEIEEDDDEENDNKCK